VDDANDAFLKIVGYTREDMLQGLLNKSVITPREHAEMDRLKWGEVVERGTIVPYEKEYLRKDGRRVPVLIGASMIDSERDTRVSFVLDITTRKLAERALMSRAAQQAAVAKFGERALVADDLLRSEE